MSMMPIYVISNGDLFREAFNAIVTVLGETTYHTAMRISALFAILTVSFQYTKTRDLTVMAKWFALYTSVSVILLAPKIPVEIIDSSDPQAVYAVDNVPYGLAMPASIITQISHALTKAMDTAFHMPDDATYHQTGMLFGSRLYKLGASYHFIDTDIQNDFYAYVRNCVMGDILINKKYSWQNLKNSTDIWKTITQNASLVRGIMDHKGAFLTCRAAISEIQQGINDDISHNALKIFGHQVFGQNAKDNVSQVFSQYLNSAYQFYGTSANSASAILMQNVMINGIRNGIAHYDGLTGATATLLNISTTNSMDRMRMAWATSKNMAAYTLPLMNTIILLLLLCLFPTIVLLSLQPNLSFGVLKNYCYSLIWVESWPMLFACLNLATTFYLKHKIGGIVPLGLTLSNFDQVMLEHSDIGSMAGYLMTCVPFIAIGIVKGMASAFNNAANYIGGMMHSTASSSATEAVMGNFSQGNVSMNNVNANKYDANSAYMHGMATQQLASGATVTQTASGNSVYNTHGAMSQLPIGMSVMSGYQNQLSHALEQSKQHTSQLSEARSSAISQSYSDLQSLSHALSHQTSSTQTTTDSSTIGMGHAVSQINSAVDSYAKQHSKSKSAAFQDLIDGYQSVNVSFSEKGGVVGGVISAFTGLNASVGGNAGVKHGDSWTHGHNTTDTTSNSHSDNLTYQFRENMDYLKSHAKSQSSSIGDNKIISSSNQFSQDIRKVDNLTQAYNESMTQTERDSKLHSYVAIHAENIQENFAQEFANHVQKADPKNADYILGDTSAPQWAHRRDILANQFFNERFKHQIEQGID